MVKCMAQHLTHVVLLDKAIIVNPKALAIYAVKKQQLIEAGRDVFPDVNLAL